MGVLIRVVRTSMLNGETIFWSFLWKKLTHPITGYQPIELLSFSFAVAIQLEVRSLQDGLST